MITELGKELRKIRIEANERLFDMAGKIKKSSSFISAVEIGNKAPPSGFEEAVIQSYGLAADAAAALRRAADRARTAFTIAPTTVLGRDTAGLLARHMDDLSETDLKDIHDILIKKRG